MNQQQEEVFTALIVIGIDPLTALAATSGDEPDPKRPKSKPGCLVGLPGLAVLIVWHLFW